MSDSIVSSMDQARQSDNTIEQVATETTQIVQEQQDNNMNITTQTEEIATEQIKEAMSPIMLALQDGKYKFIQQFGGQGNSYWSELKHLYEQVNDVKTLIKEASEALKQDSSSNEAQTSPAFECVLRLEEWLSIDNSNANSTQQEIVSPTAEQLSLAFFSYPLIALTQAANYIAFLNKVGASHETIIANTSCSIGHSQGVVLSVLFSCSKTKSDFMEKAIQFVRYMFWQGLRSQEAFLQVVSSIPSGPLKAPKEATPMLAIRGLTRTQVEKAVEVANRRTGTNDLQLSLVNGNTKFCVTGLPMTLELLRQTLEKVIAPKDASQNRLPFSERKPVGSLAYVRLSCPFHSTLLTSAKSKIIEDIERIGLVVIGKQLQVPVYTTCSSCDNLQSFEGKNVVAELVSLQLIKQVDWIATSRAIAELHSNSTHVLDFGPDRGAASLICNTAEGVGIETIVATPRHEVLPLSIDALPIFGLNYFMENTVKKHPSWEQEFGPHVASDGQSIVNKYTSRLRKQPVIVGGMTPTTSLNGIDLVAAIQNAGFYGELAAGGLSRPQIFQDAVNDLVSKIQPGAGISINMLYLNAKQWGFQFPMVLQMRRRGIPIESITIGAGIPTKDRAVEIMKDLQSVGINMLGLKPGSVDSIYAALEIANEMPSMTIMLQWTGGRAGGHHSFEDFHHPLEQTYGAIRRSKNVLLVVGSGFGNWEDSHEYISGEWSKKRGLLVKMPVDGILIASRVMVAKEAATAPEIKKLLVNTPGIISELEWEQSYKGIAGGIATVTSELGEPIHKVANRGVLCWREFDDKYFTKSKDEMTLAVRLDKENIIKRLNEDFQKVYFGVKVSSSGETTPADLEEMTYGAVLSRMVELMFVELPDRPQRWIHDTFRTRVAKFMDRAEQLLRRHNTEGTLFDSEKQNLLENPRACIQAFLEQYPKAKSTLLTAQDCDYFLDLCRTGGKPVNFIPIIDSELKTWFKKDSLWYSEDLDAVPGRDADRVCILQGPVAVRYSTVVDEPVGKIMGDMARGYAAEFAKSSIVSVQSSNVVEKANITAIAGLPVAKMENGLKIEISRDSVLPSTDEWISELAESISSLWLVALLTSRYIVQGKMWLPNPVRNLVSPQHNQTIVIDEKCDCMHIFDSSLNLNEPVIEIMQEEDSINVLIREVRPQVTELEASVIKFQLTFQYYPNIACTIHQKVSTAIDDIKAFYARFWVAESGKEEESAAVACNESVLTVAKGDFTITPEDITSYKRSLGINDGILAAPLDFATVAGWKPLIKSVFTKEVEGSLLDLVHLKHSYKLLADDVESQYLFHPGDEISSTFTVSSLRIIESGKIVSGRGVLSRKGVNELMEETFVPLVELKSEFLIRGSFSDFTSTFSITESNETIFLQRADDVKLLQSMTWFKQVSETVAPLEVGDNLKFSWTTKKTFSSTNTVSSIELSGSVSRLDATCNDVILADIAYKGDAGLQESPVDLFISKIPKENVSNGNFAERGYNMLPQPLEINVPESALEYAVASRDLNPIHRSNYAAILAKLPHGKPIMHGMWTATKVRALIVQHFGGSIDSNVCAYDANFDGMVYPGDRLFVQVRHIGMDCGKKILSVEVVNSAGERVVSARAIVRQPPAAFVFTGQGSAEVGMGMDRYAESSVARDTWNAGDAHLQTTFGFSILEIVRKNPTSLTIHFGGKRGRVHRANFMKLTCEDPETGETTPLLPEINKRTQSFTFSAPEGLLFATQFSQPALVLLEKATFAEIQAAQLVPRDAMFAGHSLGEYAGLAAFASALPIENVVEVVFLRGLIMQRAVKRDAAGRSDYGMVAANPRRVSPKFSVDTMDELVDGISKASGKLLQVVNYNVKDYQYVVAGENVNLEAFSTCLTAYKNGKVTDMNTTIADSLAAAQARKDSCTAAGRPFTQTRGTATIPLVGIDVPFHSRELLGGVPSFRSLLRSKFSPKTLERQLSFMVGRYIPNLVAIPFSLEKSYFEKVYAATNSPYIAEVLDPMQWNLTTKGQLAHLLVVELLAYQFASPVQWIKTQDYLFTLNGEGVQRFIEIGPALTLTGMAQRTLATGNFPDMKREILWCKRDREAIYYEVENTNVSASEFARALAAAEVEKNAASAVASAASMGPDDTETSNVEVSSANAQSPTPPQLSTPMQLPPSMPIAAAAQAPDAPVTPEHVLRVMLATRLNKKLEEVSPDTDVKTLCAGKSAVQNEILGDLEKEFGGAPDGAGEVPLKELAAKFQSYNALGKVMNGMVSKVIASKMPGGFTMSSAKDYLGGNKGLGPGRMESVFAHCLLLAPSARLKSESEAKQWLDSCVDSYATFAGVSLAKPAASVASPMMGMAFAQSPVSIPTVTDAPVDAKHALMVLLAAKMGKSFSEVTDTTTIKELASGKSAVQNEVVGDLEKEFGSGPDDTPELKLADLAAKFPGYNSPGKVTSAMIAKLLASKMPGGFGVSSVKDYLATERCLPAGRIESVLLHSLTQNPKARFSDDAQAKQWLDSVTDDYAKFSNIEIPYLSKLGGAAGGLMQMQGAVGQSAALPSDFDKTLKAMFAEQVEALNGYLGKDELSWHSKLETESELRADVESVVDRWNIEHGEFYGNGIATKFDPKKERLYDSYWNWATQDALELYYTTILAGSGVLPTTTSGVVQAHFKAMSSFINTNVTAVSEGDVKPPLEWFKPLLCNRATPELLTATQYFIQRAKSEGRHEIAQAVQLLAEQLEAWLKINPVNIQIFCPTKPHLEISESGEMSYSEIPRPGVNDSIEYVDELARGLEYVSAEETQFFGSANVTMESAHGFEATIQEFSGSDEESEEEAEESLPAVNVKAPKAPLKQGTKKVKGEKLEALRGTLQQRNNSQPTQRLSRTESLVGKSSNIRSDLNENLKQFVLPHVHIRKPSDADPTIRLYDVELTCMLLNSMREMATVGVSFCEKVALVTGCGKNSIGAELVKNLLEGGATVFVTTSSFSSTTTSVFRHIYEQHGSKGSKLYVLPFNQASKVDVQNIVKHIYDTHQLDIDYIIPFAALSEVGRMLTDIDSRSELAHRIMLTNTMRLLGEIITAKKVRNITTRPALALIPLSPNHGDFGGDGLYAEGKLGCESLMKKWYSEGWEDQLSIVGAVIGWTRGTGLMSGNNMVAEGVEELGLRTFNTQEMGFNLTVLLHPTVVERAVDGPIYADLTGGMAQLADLKLQVDSVRSTVMQRAKTQAYLYSSKSSSIALNTKQFEPKANLSGYFCDVFPSISTVPTLAKDTKQRQLGDLIDLRDTVVVTGFGEVGPWGNSRTRWEMESYGEFSLEGCIELAWLTGYITYKDGNWIDSKTKAVVRDRDIKAKYEDEMLEHCGIRFIEPELFDGYDPKKKMILHQVAIDKQMAPIEVADHEEALAFRNELGKENVSIYQNESGAWMIRLKKGSVLCIPRTLAFDRFVAGQVPTGWDPERLGVPKDLVDSVDRITMYTLVSTMDAFITAGVTDPYEFYQYVHVSEVGNTSGGGMGGMNAFKKIYHHRLLGKDAPSDTLQECFINTAPAWVNMLLLSSSGPIKTPVGACATAAESVDIGVETIKSGKARIVIVGGYDDFGEEGSYEFAQMKATSDSVKEASMGREPREMCRPCSTTRGGFMESHGAGMQMLMDAQLAIEMGLPIYAVVALTNTATDKNGRSIPAPGQGILTTAREYHSSAGAKAVSRRLLDVSYRHAQFNAEIASIEAWYISECTLTENNDDAYLTFLDELKVRKLQSAQKMWGSGFYIGRPDIAPLRGALSTWNLTVDDIGVASFHGTGTTANDKNESEVTQKQMAHLGRSAGNPLPVICQKNLTGHPKGAAAAWMLNGLLQVLNTGLIPGNRNLDNTSKELRAFDYLLYPNRPIQTDKVKAALMKSFGFGQAGGEILLVHPDYLLSALNETEFVSYSSRRESRLVKMNAYLQKSVIGKHTFVQVKNSAPYSPAIESQVYLDPTARAAFDPVANTWKFEGGEAPKVKSKKHKKTTTTNVEDTLTKKETSHSTTSAQSLESALSQTATSVGLSGSSSGMLGVGVDVEPIATFDNLHGREDFIRRNFTDQEMAYCYSAPSPAASFAGRWSAKEAVIKAISSAVPNESNLWKGAGAPLREIEVFMTASGAPSVSLSGYPLQVFNRVGLKSISVSISHSGDFAVAQAVASFHQ